VIDCVRAPETATMEPGNAPAVRLPARPRETTVLAAKRMPDAWLRRLPSASPRRARLIAEAMIDGPVATSVPAPGIVDKASIRLPAGAREATPLVAHRLPGAWLRRLPSAFPRRAKLITEGDAIGASPATSVAAPAIVELAPVAPIAPPIPVPRPPTEGAAASAAARNLNGRFSIARQLGLGISRIVIDPGHGGHDPGATGKDVTEAEIVLDVALRLEKLLQKAQDVEVILTRRTDEFIPLPERTAIANRESADLFLSIHANASQNGQARGVETYFLNFANNLTAAAVAARENATSGQAMGALPDFVKAIALNDKLDESRDFATEVQRAMVARLRTANKNVRDLGVKQAPFVVLIGAAMPSVLAEVSFVTNAQEAKLLKGNVYRQRIAESLFNAIRKYQGALKNGKAVASQ
jgi:N-acetylmuramoyl-L-alanine amidase